VHDYGLKERSRSALAKTLTLERTIAAAASGGASSPRRVHRYRDLYCGGHNACLLWLGVIAACNVIL